MNKLYICVNLQIKYSSNHIVLSESKLREILGFQSLIYQPDSSIRYLFVFVYDIQMQFHLLIYFRTLNILPT